MKKKYINKNKISKIYKNNQIISIRNFKNQIEINKMIKMSNIIKCSNKFKSWKKKINSLINLFKQNNKK